MTGEGKIRIGAVVGCTASGKTALAIELAKRLDGEIICCDSMQIYKGMDIGTAKPTAEERKTVAHHLTDFLSPDVPYSCADYVKDAEKAVEDITSRGKFPLFCGGTGLYLDRFLKGGTEDGAVSLPEYREELYKYAQTHGAGALYAILEQKDKECAASVHPNNIKRVVRALEIIEATGEKKSDVDKRNSRMTDKYESVVIFPYFNDRSLLYSRIDRRVDKMMADGLADETERLYRDGVFDKSFTASQAIGYKELLPYVLGEDTLENCIEKLKTATRRYAKRQLTWFSSKEYAQKVEMDDANGEKMFEDIVNISEKLFYC